MKQMRLSIFLYLPLAISILSLHESGIISMFGYIALYFLVIFAILLQFYSFKNTKFLYRCYGISYLMIFLYALSNIISDPNLDNSLGLVQRLLQLISVVSILHIGYVFGSGLDGDYEIVVYRKIFLLTIFFVSAIFFLISIFGSDFKNKNPYGAWLAIAGLISLGNFNKKKSIGVFAIILLLMLVNSGSRTALISFSGGLFVYYIWPYLCARRNLYWAVLLSSFILSYLIINFTFTSLGQIWNLNLISQDLSGKNFNSGRDIIWPVAWELIVEKPWLGRGGGIQLSHLSDFDLSTHNFYLQILLQVGFVGLTFVVLFFLSLWQKFWEARYSSYIRSAASIFFAMLLSQNFEVFILQGNIAVSWPMWMFVGLAFGSSANSKYFIATR
ncbi:O-antigen ligase family protein [Polynucleobacter sp. MG-28-Ekke-A2]|uniref:O-antigen ligase family protein n=1 Tax=Polynucleobacter sp. MG-28-Ekke-A2 TaxID=3108276 RepID=UPI002B224D52|nr:O-antigen ligase family protein [Polynucleobacter sp. MG-28-Ekke-A2]MEA9601198.1 O-antigen ligase family protein [Polynucleobacter sp. MG-28-Ekke-A2]